MRMYLNHNELQVVSLATAVKGRLAELNRELMRLYDLITLGQLDEGLAEIATERMHRIQAYKQVLIKEIGAPLSGYIKKLKARRAA